MSSSRARFALAGPALVANWLNHVMRNAMVGVLAQFLVILFLSFIAAMMLKHVLKDESVTASKIYSSLCVYLLFGLIWAAVYYVLETMQPGSLSLQLPDHEAGRKLYSSCIHFSYVTLTTLGYGDITPQSAPARSLSFVEAVTGQLYLAVVVARLVGLHIAHSSKA